MRLVWGYTHFDLLTCRLAHLRIWLSPRLQHVCSDQRTMRLRNEQHMAGGWTTLSRPAQQWNRWVQQWPQRRSPCRNEHIRRLSRRQLLRHHLWSQYVTALASLTDSRTDIWRSRLQGELDDQDLQPEDVGRMEGNTTMSKGGEI